MSDIIQLLPDHVANQIAAGEVVQRPASVVKELLENAIDANSSQIKLIIKDAGKTLIQVIDDGVGMSVTDARLSFERHATSKIKSAKDLFNINTKGFRGEALASIAAVAHVELKTKRENNQLGTCIAIEGSEVKSQEVTVTPKGTSVAVKNLFYNIPARRNFLKSDTVELRHIIDEFHRVALAHPSLVFSLFHNGNELFSLPKGNYRQRIVNIFGTKTNEKLVPVKENTEILKVEGFVAKPEYAKKTRGEQFFFVNERYIKSPYLNHAVNSAFEGLLRPKTHASYFLYLQVEPKTIDINIHPTKTEIKFEDEHTLYAILRSAVKHSLGKFSIAPVLDFDRDGNLDTPYDYKSKDATSPKIEVDKSFNPFKDNQKQFFGHSFKKETNQNWEGLYIGLESKSNTNKNDFSSVEFESDELASSMFDNDENIKHQKTFQVKNKYIINTIKSGMMIIDQNRAHQRILYEEFLQNLTVTEPVSQQLLFPIRLNYTSTELTILDNLKVQLEHAGFVFCKLDNDEIEIKGMPLAMSEDKVKSTLEHLINDVENEVPDSSFSPTDMLAKSLAKSLAIKNGKTMGVIEQENLVNRLFACKDPSISPQGQNTFITMRVEDLDKKFR